MSSIITSVFIIGRCYSVQHRVLFLFWEPLAVVLAGLAAVLAGLTVNSPTTLVFFPALSFLGAISV